MMNSQCGTKENRTQFCYLQCQRLHPPGPAWALSLHFAEGYTEVSWVASSSSSSHQLPIMGEPQEELQKVHVRGGHPLLTRSNLLVDGDAGDAGGQVAGECEAAAAAAAGSLAWCCLSALPRRSGFTACCFTSHTGSLICSSQGSAQRGLPALFPVLTFTGSDSDLEKRQSCPGEVLGKCFHFKVGVSYKYLQMFIEVE